MPTTPHRSHFVLLGFLAVWVISLSGQPLESLSSSTPIHAKPFLATLPLTFIENRGQWDQSVRFLARKGPHVAWFDTHSIRLHLGSDLPVSLRLTFDGASKGTTVVGEGRQDGHYNFYVGNDQMRWRSDVPAYTSVRYREMYDGVDVRVRQAGNRLEYDVLLAAAANLDSVVVRVDGVARLELAPDGSLIFHTDAGSLRQLPPSTWEVLPAGDLRPVPCRFRLIGPDRYGFEVPARNPRLALVIDPGLEWSTFLGGSGPDVIGPAVPARDGSGDVFVGGTTKSPDFPLFSDPSFTPMVQDRAFVARLNAAGSAIVYGTFFGGWHSQLVFRGLAADRGGNAVLVGQTLSPDFPTTPGVVDRICENKDAFVVRLNPKGGLIFSTCLGGSSEDLATSVAYDPDGNIVVGGVTTSSDYPTTPGAFDTTYNAPNAPADGGAHGDMFVTRLTPFGTQITYSTFIGGPSLDSLEDLVVDSLGNVTVAGWVTGNNIKVFVTTPDAFDATWNGSYDAVIARLRLDGAGTADLKYATLIGGSSQDNFWVAAVDPTNPELVTFAGRSWSNNYPTTPGVVRPDNPPISPLFPNTQAAIVTRFRFPATGGGTLVWSTYHHAVRITGLTVNEAGEPIVVGSEAPWDLLTTRGAFQRVARGSGKVSASFISRLSRDAARYEYQSFLGGSRGAEGDSLQTTPQVAHVAGNTVIVSGQTTASDFPVTPFAADPTSSNAAGGGASSEGFVTKITLDADASGDLTADPPALVSPGDGATFHSGLIGRIEWSGVVDVSDVEAYEFQVSSRSDFPKGFILFRGGVRETEVVIPPSRELPQVPLFWRVRTADRAGNLSGWSVPRSFTVSPTTGQPTISFIQIHPAGGVAGGTQATGMLQMSDPAPAGGLVARLTAHHDRTIGLDLSRTLPVPASVPATVTILEGALTAPFSIDTKAVAELTKVTLVATVNGVGNQAHMSVLAPSSAPKPIAASFTPLSVTGGNVVTGTVTLSGPAPTGGTDVSLLSSHPAVASLPASVTVPAGSTSANFSVTTSPVSVEINVQVEAKSGGGRWLANLYVRPANLPRLTSMTISPTSVTGGGRSGGTLTFSGPIPRGAWPALADAVVRLSSSDPEVAAALEGSGKVLAGSTTHSFGIFTRGVGATRQVTLSASYDTVTLSGVLTVGAVTDAVSSITATVSNLRGGEGAIATINLTAPAPAPLLITLATDRPELFSSLPTSVVVSTGSTSKTFTLITNKSATATTPVSVTAAYGASVKSLALTVGPPAAPVPPIISVALNPSRVTGGGSSTGTVTLKSAAPAGGAVVELFSSNTSAATVPVSVTVPAGATSAAFSVSTAAVSADTSVPISGLLYLTASTVLTVTALPAAAAADAPQSRSGRKAASRPMSGRNAHSR
ncbi:MAG: hypothetical protein AUH72_13405 [Acidobacteria bacterium 13_1_40CM_4_65_8]|nr:MAG: hypothetical protein AUH72_13405 [Acidobacteria bacterium 13_1_40CM_4_65_8]